jgi:hypothetical protein
MLYPSMIVQINNAFVDCWLTRQSKYTRLRSEFRQVSLPILFRILHSCHNLTFKFCTVVKAWALHTKINENGDVHISPTYHHASLLKIINITGSLFRGLGAYLPRRVCAQYGIWQNPMRSKTAAQLKHIIKTEPGIYTSLQCQHASEEGEHLFCSPTFRVLTNLVQLC